MFIFLSVFMLSHGSRNNVDDIHSGESRSYGNGERAHDKPPLSRSRCDRDFRQRLGFIPQAAMPRI